MQIRAASDNREHSQFPGLTGSCDAESELKPSRIAKFPGQARIRAMAARIVPALLLLTAVAACEEKLPDKDDMESAAQHNQQGVQALNAADLNRALAHFQKATELDTVTPDYPNNIGIVYLNQSEFEEAREAFQEALNRDPRYIRAHYNMGVAFQNDGQPERAAQAYRNTLQLSPQEFPALYNLGLVLMRTEELAEAREAFKAFLALAPRNLEKPRADAVARIKEIDGKIGPEKAKDEKEADSEDEN